VPGEKKFGKNIILHDLPLPPPSFIHTTLSPFLGTPKKNFCADMMMA